MRPNSWSTLLFCGALIASGPIATDMFSLIVPMIRDDFAVDVATVQLTLTAFVAGYALGQLWVGPLADRYGRRPLLQIGLALFFVATAACAFAPTIEILVVGRFFQAIGASGAWILNRTIIRDIHDARGTTRMMAQTTMIMGGFSTIVPTLGGLLAGELGWRAVIFAALAYVAGLNVMVALAYRETVRQKNPHAIDPVPLLRNMAMLMRDRRFAGYTLTVCFVLMGMFVFVSNGAFVFISVFDLSPPQFGLVFTAIATTFICGNFLADRMTRRHALPNVCAGALSVSATGAVLLVLGAFLAPGTATILVPVTMITFGLGFLMPLCFAGAMAPFPEVAGTASSLIGFLQALGSVLTGQLVSLLFDGSPRPLAALMALCVGGAVVAFIVVLGPLVRRRG
jgi:DHA1 family bicyclomycin/chloramphenicol resistance-like MFS transporter